MMKCAPILLFGIAAFCQTPPPDLGQIAAQVEDEYILQDDVYKLATAQFSKAAKEDPKLVTRALISLIYDRIYEREAKKSSIDVKTDEIEKQINSEILAMPGKDLVEKREKFERLLNARNMTMSEYRDEVKKRIRAQKVIAYHMRRYAYEPGKSGHVLISVATPRETYDYFDRNRDQFKGIEQLTIDRIICRFSDETQKEAAREKATYIYEKVMAGVEFRYPWVNDSDLRDDPTRHLEGVSKENSFFTKEINEMLFNDSKDGTVFAPALNGNQYEILKVVFVAKIPPRTFADAQESIIHQIENEKFERHKSIIRRELWEKYFVYPRPSLE